MSPAGTSTITPSSRGTPDASGAPPDPKYKETRMSLSPENTGAVEPTPSAINRRTMLKRAAAAGLVAVPAVGLLEACAGGGSGSGSSGSTGTSNDANNPLGVKDGTTVNVV